MSESSLVGYMFTPFTFEIERGKIHEFALAIGDLNPIYHDKAAALAAGYKDVPAPPTFPTVVGMWGNPRGGGDMRRAGIPLERVLHGEENYTYLRPLYAGDTVTSQQKVVAVARKEGRSGIMDLVTLETTYTNQDGEVAVKSGTVVVVRGGLLPQESAE